MTDIHGNPDLADLGHDPVMGDGRLAPFHPAIDRPRDDLPFSPIEPGLSSAAIFLLYAAFALPYVYGFVGFLPRTSWHNAAVAAAALPSLLAAGFWPEVRRIPIIGPALYLVPGLALATLPFSFDFYLMFGR
jgi:hypothetical protein